MNAEELIEWIRAEISNSIDKKALALSEEDHKTVWFHLGRMVALLEVIDRIPTYTAKDLSSSADK